MDTTYCQQLPRRSRLCRNPALPGSNPPRCRRHHAADVDEAAVAVQMELPGMPPRELDAPHSGPPQSNDDAPDLRGELTMVRRVLRGLVQALNDSDRSAEEARRLSALIFSGARTVAHLLDQQAKQSVESQDWMTAALEALGDDFAPEL